MSLPYSDPSNPALPSPLFSDLTAARGDHLRANNNAIFNDLTYLDDLIAANFLRTIYGDNAYGSTLVTDFNAITKSGFYTGYGAATGAPNTSYSWFVLHQNSAVGVASMYQRAVAFSTAIVVYERTKISSTWGAWKESGIDPTGVEKMFFGDSIPSGWVLEDGKSLATSGGDYNGAAYYNLYIHIWGLVDRAVVPSTYLSATKGASAAADWAAGKKIYLPNRQATSPKGAGTQTINTRSKTGPALGVAEEDQGQGHWHKIGTALSGSGANSSMSSSDTRYGNASVIGPTGGQYMGGIAYDMVAAIGSDAPRTGTTTRDNTLGTNFIIKL